jgi:hypothetical protein
MERVMKSEPEGPGWWMASDGRWYPPEVHPAVLSGSATTDELRAQPLARAADRTSIRWVAEADDRTPSPPEVEVPAPGGDPAETPAPGDVPLPDHLREPTTGSRPEVGTDVRVGVATIGTDGADEEDLPPERPSRFLLLGVAAAAIALVAISAVTFVRNRDADDDPTTPGTVPQTDDGTAAVASAGDLELGDCLAHPDGLGQVAGGDVADLRRVACDEPHTHEVFLATAFETSGSFELDRITSAATITCTAAFEEFVGVAYERSRLRFFALTPTRDGWENGDRALACLLYDDAPVSGSLRDAGV